MVLHGKFLMIIVIKIYLRPEPLPKEKQLYQLFGGQNPNNLEVGVS